MPLKFAARAFRVIPCGEPQLEELIEENAQLGMEVLGNGAVQRGRGALEVDGFLQPPKVELAIVLDANAAHVGLIQGRRDVRNVL